MLGLLAFLPSPVLADPLDRWRPQIEEASARFGLPASWIRSVMRVESGGQLVVKGRPIVSPAGAMGLMQLMPATWREMRDRLGLGQDVFDPRDNILAGTAYLRAMYDRYGYVGMLAAYNAGPSRYEAFLLGRQLPAETLRYLRLASSRARSVGNGAAPSYRVTTPTKIGLFVALTERKVRDCPDEMTCPKHLFVSEPSAGTLFARLSN